MPTAVAPVIPMLNYSDAGAAITFLCAAFGFEEVGRLEMEGGVIGHAELRMGPARVTLASCFPGMGLVSPRVLEGVSVQLRVMVDDVDAHHAHAAAAGATIVTAPEDQFYGERVYRAVDPEGHRWVFAQTVEALTFDEVAERAR
jgi:PhnB protein